MLYVRFLQLLQALFDVCYENYGCQIQPETDVPEAIEECDSIENITATTNGKDVESNRKKLYKTPLDEDMHSSMTDFQLAETNLMECLLRTNIIERIQ